MKTKTFLWALLPMMAAALMTTACSSDDDSTVVTPKPAADQTVKSIPYTVTVGQGTTTRASVADDDVTLQFADGDKLYVEDNSGSVYGCLTLQSGDAGKATGATFSGDLNYTGDEPADNLQLTATLVGINDELANVSGDKVMGFENYPTTICATMAEAVQKYCKLTGSSTYGAKNFALSQETAFLKFSVTLEDGTTNGATVPVVIKNGSTTIGTGSVTATGENQFIDIKADFVLPVANGTTIAAGSTMCVANVGEDTESITYSSTAKTLSGGVYTITKTKDFVRLWAGGPVWATRNLGASSVTGYGNYYAWGETTGYAESESHDFSWANYSLCNGSETTLTRYNNISDYGTVDSKTELETTDDAAYAASGGFWRMPTDDEFDNSTGLLANTTNAPTTVDGVNGKTFTGTGDYKYKAIFLPTAGYFNGTSPKDQGERGYFWSSSLRPDRPRSAYNLSVGRNTIISTGTRFYGQNIRAVHN
ncbi:MAG: hypothetical protein IJV38_11150 [Prevotella sp.]|nr:hypothetical protein [Prevotella sp.]